jgi:hypothetical protein
LTDPYETYSLKHNMKGKEVYKEDIVAASKLVMITSELRFGISDSLF